MVCPRCIISVRSIFDSLDINVSSIMLGEIVVHGQIQNKQKKRLAEELHLQGFELLVDTKSQTIEKIKSTIIESIHFSDQHAMINFSTLISDKLGQDYSSISRLFSAVEGRTIERFIVSQKIERVKELLFYNQLTLSEIAFKMNYSSVAYLSSQFKKETGMTPTAFKKQNSPGHLSLDRI